MSGQIFKPPRGATDLHAAPSLSESLALLVARRPEPEDLQRAALHLLDWIGCAIAGAATATGRQVAVVTGGPPLAGAGRGTALGMGALGSLLEMDDVHRAALLHPGPVVWPSLLALGPAPGPVLLSAGLRGYEAMIRLGHAVGPRHYAFFHNTSTCGGAGAAVAAASLLGLPDDAVAGAIGHALSVAGGLWQCRNEGVPTKHLHVAEAAERGLRAARFAAAGLGGPRRILEGAQGFFAAVAPDGDPLRVTSDPAAPWLIHETSFKPWPACRHAHPAIDAALLLRGALGGTAPAAVTVRTYDDALLFCDRPDPRTGAEARFSLQHAVAVALAEGPPRLGAFDPEELSGPAALRARVRLERDEALSTAYPAHFGAEVTVEAQDGTTRTARVADAWGDPENPLAPEDVVAKFHRLAAWAGTPSAAAEALRDAALALPRADGTASLLAALSAAIPDREAA